MLSISHGSALSVMLGLASCPPFPIRARRSRVCRRWPTRRRSHPSPTGLIRTSSSRASSCLTDIANEPDDQMSFVRLLVSSNQFDLAALVATTSRHLRDLPRPDVLRSVIDAYGKVQPNLATHEPGFPTADALAKLVVVGQDSYGMAAACEGRMTPGAEAIIRAADSADPQPLWVSIRGGANTLAQALWHLRRRARWPTCSISSTSSACTRSLIRTMRGVAPARVSNPPLHRHAWGHQRLPRGHVDGDCR